MLPSVSTMTFKRSILIVALLLLCVGTIKAQLKLPTFDVELKIQQTLLPGEGDNDGQLEFAETTNFYGGAHVQINQYVAIGGYYGRSFRGNAKFKNGIGSTENETLQLQKGIDIRVSTSRAKKWRKYLVVNYGQIEYVSVKESFRLADKSAAFGANLGLMRRLSNNLYLTVIELGVKVMSDDIFWFEAPDADNIIAEAKMGLVYNIGKRK